MIAPTVGRVVWFYPRGLSDVLANAQPHAALVAHVWSDRCVNLAVFDADGVAYSRTSVPLMQEGDRMDSPAPFCCWMPYQIGQAKKHETAPAPAA